MTDAAPTGAHILVVAATAREIAPAAGWRTLLCGVGPVDAAAATAAEIAAHRPAAILHVGIAGARQSSALSPGTLVVGTESHYCDLGVPEQFAPRVVAPSALLLEAVLRALPGAPALSIGTTAHVGGSLRSGRAATASHDGTRDCDVEAMEGFAVLRAAQLAGVPAIEVRAISNEIEEKDRARWHFDAAFRAIRLVTPMLVQTIHLALADAPPSGATQTDRSHA